MFPKKLSETERGDKDSLEHSLRCLGHSSVIASVFLLLINDSVLKYRFPGVVTGKLSDFSGLYFFPFLLILGMSLLSRKIKLNHRATSVVSFLVVALLFTGMKTVPWINIGVERLLGVVTGTPSVISLDPTDLIALPVLLLSWTLWDRLKIGKPKEYAWIIVIFAVVGSLATSCRDPRVITDLVAAKGRIYAFASKYEDWYVSEDEGKTWQTTSEVPPEIEEKVDTGVDLPKTICDPYQSDHCFRVSGKEYVEESRDGGQSWEMIWEIPPGRRKVMERFARGTLCSKTIDLGPYDIAFVGEKEDRIAVVAMGNEGALRVNKDGPLPRVPVGKFSTPTPYLARSFRSSVDLLSTEMIVLFFAGFLWWMVLNWIYWEPVIKRLVSMPSPVKSTSWILKPVKETAKVFSAFFVVVIVLYLLGFTNYNRAVFSWLLIRVAILVEIIVLGLGFLSAWWRLSSAVSHSPQVRKAFMSIVASSLAFLFLGFFPMYLWTINIIHHYDISILISLNLVVLGIILSIIWVRSNVRSTTDAIPS